MNLLVNSNASHIPLPDESVNCVVTSPPYYGLRDYGTAKWEGGDPDCEHTISDWNDSMKPHVDRPERDGAKRQFCLKCGASRIDQQIGLEETPKAYVENMVMVGREIWRVLRDDGTWWLNLGDSYSGSGEGGGGNRKGNEHGQHDAMKGNRPDIAPGLKPKDLIGIPWEVAFALRSDGWYLRKDIIWHKISAMPESVKDRPTSAHEYIFLLTKSERYYYDYYAILEDAAYDGRKDTTMKGSDKYNEVSTQSLARYPGERWPNEVNGVKKRNKRSVWSVSTANYKGAHYATFNPDLIEPCILAGCPETVCSECGAPYERVVEKVGKFQRRWSVNNKDGSPYNAQDSFQNLYNDKGFQPTCTCDAGTKPGIVLDPFVGSGTTCYVAEMHSRDAIGLDLSFEYLDKNARERLRYGNYIPVGDDMIQKGLF